MRVARFATATGAVALLSACFGDGSGSGGTPAPTPTPTPTVSLSASSVDATIAEGTTATFGFDASFSGTGGQTVVPDVSIGGKRYALDGAPTVTGSSVAVRFKTLPFQPAGKESSTVTFRLCTSADCGTVIANSTKTFAVNLDFKLNDWATLQRDNAHSGYVAVAYDPARFARAWEWQGPEGARAANPAATSGLVVVTYPGSPVATTFALNAATGGVAWHYDMGRQFYVSDPTIAEGRVYASSIYTSSEANPLWVFALEDGTLLKQLSFGSQYAELGQPTAIGTKTFVAQGYYGNVLYGYDAAAGTKIWEKTVPPPNIYGGETLAADDRYLYFYTSSLHQVDAASGQIVRSIADPEATFLPFAYPGGPALDGNGNAFVHSASTYRIARFSLGSGSVSWYSDVPYGIGYAIAHGAIYAARQDTHALAAIDIATGKELWSAPLPGGDFIAGNVVVTENLAFVSSATATWAIDLKNAAHPVAWTAPTGGRLAITPSNLLLTTGGGEVTAYKLD